MKNVCVVGDYASGLQESEFLGNVHTTITHQS